MIEPADLYAGVASGANTSAAVGSGEVVQLASAEANRRGMTIENLGPDALFVGLSDAGAAADVGIAVFASGVATYDTYRGPVFGISGGSSDVRIERILPAE